jgi:tetratricopeptide (TPR) repeat protein
MKQLNSMIPGIMLLCMFLVNSTANSQLLDLPRASQLASVSQRIGITDVGVAYSRPNVAERPVWGQLVPYGMNNLGFGSAKEAPWRAGANENTVISFSDAVSIEGQPLDAGSYGLHMVIHEDDRATVIFSRNHTAWGSFFYDPSEDALRVEVGTTEIPHTEQLTYLFTDVDQNSATLSLNWEKKQIPFKISADVTQLVIEDIREKLQNSPGFNRQSWEQAANFSLNNGGDLDEALSWINKAIEGQFFSQKTFNNLQVKAQILDKLGKTEEGAALMKESLEIGTVFEIHQYGRQLIAQGQTNEALEVFKRNSKTYKNTWPVDYGLARGYSATGDYQEAIKHLKIAAGRAPDQLNKDAVTANIQKLEKGEDIN